MQVEATAIVPNEMAARIPREPELVEECLRQAQEAMVELASERNRHLAEKPRYVDLRETGLGYVELRFVADTESD